MQFIEAADPLTWFLMSYLLGAMACGAWTLLVQVIRAAAGPGTGDHAL